MIGNAPQSPITGVPGWETQAEQELLMKYAALAPESSVIAEIGGEFGMSASLFAKAAPPSVQIFTVDLFPGDLLDKHVSNLAEAGFAGRTEPIRDNSHVLAGARTKSLLDNGYWLLFVDGDHTFEGVLADLQLWANGVWEGGYIVLHDVAQSTNKLPHLLHFEVTRAINAWRDGTPDWAKQWEHVDAVDTMLVMKRIAVPVVETEETGTSHSDEPLPPVDESVYPDDAEALPVEDVVAEDGDADEAPKPKGSRTRKG